MINYRELERIFLGIPIPQDTPTLNDNLPDIVGRIRVYLMINAARRL